MKLSKQQINNLLEKAKSSKNRTAVFEEMANKTGKKAHSIRNFYYAYISRNPEKGSKRNFERFADNETLQLIRNVIMNTSRGVSVRSTVLAMAGGNKRIALRFQNKYRAITAKHPHMVEKVCAQLEAEGMIVLNPLHEKLSKKPSAKIYHLPQNNVEESLSDSDLTNLLMGFIRLVESTATNGQIAKLREQIEVLKKQLDSKTDNA